MRINNIIKKLVKKYGTNNPFEIAKQIGIKVEYAPLGDTLGFYYYDRRIQFININNQIEEGQQTFTCAHALGRAVLHKHSNTPFLKKNTLYPISKIEREANEFAIALLSYGAEIHTGMTVYECGQIYGIPEQLREMIKK